MIDVTLTSTRWGNVSTKERIMNIQMRVAQGATLLDRKNPDWFRQINVKTLDLNSTRNCVLGQLYGDFLVGVRQIEFSSIWKTSRHGFVCSLHAGIIGICGLLRLALREHKELEQVWKAAIAVRLENVEVREVVYEAKFAI